MRLSSYGRVESAIVFLWESAGAQDDYIKDADAHPLYIRMVRVVATVLCVSEPLCYVSEPLCYVSEPLCCVSEPLCCVSEPLCCVLCACQLRVQN